MGNLLDNPRFAETYRRLADVTLNPRRHTAANALEHSEAVALRAAALARANGYGEPDVELLANLGRAHDIGKVTGTAKPEKSLELLVEQGIDDARLLALVGRHDTNLPWWMAAQKGQAPSDKAWRRLAAELDVRLLALFMIADRVDAPPGWRRNAPIVWFLGEARRRGLLGDLAVELDDGVPSEISAGGVLVRDGADGAREGLVIRVRRDAWELPKGGVEWEELPEEAAVRELHEEASVSSDIDVGRELGRVDYDVGEGSERRRKRVRYFVLRARGEPALGPCPDGTRERRWIRAEEIAELALVSDDLRPLLRAALA